MPQRCVGPGSWAWRCPEQSACSPPCLWPAPGASSAAPLSFGQLCAWPLQPWERCTDRGRNKHWEKMLWKTDMINIMNFEVLDPLRGQKFLVLLSNTQGFLLFALVIMGSLVIGLGSLQLLPGCWQLILFLIDLQTTNLIWIKKAICIKQRGNPSQKCLPIKRMTARHFFAIEGSDSDGSTEGRMLYLGLEVLHRFLKRFGWSSLVVAEDGHRPVGSVIWQDFSWNAVIS